MRTNDRADGEEHRLRGGHVPVVVVVVVVVVWQRNNIKLIN
jgi:hypothetical protein